MQADKPAYHGYVSHLREDDTPNTLCGEPWQDWQAPQGYTGSSLPPARQPRPHLDPIRFCAACVKIVRGGNE
jgi:hypothetical protein